MRIIFFLVLMALYSGPALATETGCDMRDISQMINQLGQQTNQLRAARQQHQLRPDERLNRAAQRHACDLARRQVVSHRDAQGLRPRARIERAGFSACFSAENVALGTVSAANTVGSWQKSPGHARNQQDRRARSMGFGVARGADGRLYWVGLYADDCRQRAAGQKRATGFRPFSW